ncbi:MAG TPA: exodeoxyribonuclease VII large subunit [Syntrophaceae bacterium]|nr:exodeoxyribonuclease VII large subunit [Syntrophaceae bacterium]
MDESLTWFEVAQRPIYTVSELTQRIKDILEERFPFIWVEGEISNLRAPLSGHCYFTLKDESSQIRAVIFRNQQRLLPFKLENGLKVICQGRISVYEVRGEYQILVDTIEPKGLGALQLAFEQLKQRLEREGLFDASLKKTIPYLPQRLAVITSPTGAAIRDFLKILSRRFANVEVFIYPVRVQGEGADTEIATAIYDLNQMNNIDVIILARGGGSLEDLWAFNQERVARAIFQSSIPVISAIGHEVDFTIADFVADLRAPTPSAAAELVVRRKDELTSRIQDMGYRLREAILKTIASHRDCTHNLDKRLIDPKKRLDDLRIRLDDIMGDIKTRTSQIFINKRNEMQIMIHKLFYYSPEKAIERHASYLLRLKRELSLLISKYLKLIREQLDKEMKQLHALSPLAILERGYSIARTLPDLKIITDVSSVSVGDSIHVKLAKGEIISKVEKKHG